MSYDNAEPKILKTLNSNGQVLNDLGEVISDTSDYWTKLYNQAEPKPDKILYSDGTVKDSSGNVIQNTTEFNVKKYNQAEPIPAKYLHSDGTIDENPGNGSEVELENNHQTTIDVSTYTEPVEVLPISGKNGMKKNTITLTNIPSGGSSVLYCWMYSGDGEYYCYTVSETPSVNDMVLIFGGESGLGTTPEFNSVFSITEDKLVLANPLTGDEDEMYERYANGDITL